MSDKTGQWQSSKHLPQEASGVIQCRDGRLLVINDEKDQALTLVTLNNHEITDSHPLPTTDQLDDLEGITCNQGQFIYAINGAATLFRFEINLNDNSIPEVQSIDLKEILKKHIEKKYKIKINNNNKINTEGLTWDKKTQTFLIGLRAPLTKNKKAILVFLKDSPDLFESSTPQVQNLKTDSLSLGGNGIRDLTNHVDDQNSFFIISGPSNGGHNPFAIHELTFESDRKKHSLRDIPVPGTDIEHAEGIVQIKHHGSKKFILVRDRSSELKKIKKELTNKKKIKDQLSMKGQYLIMQ